MTLAVLRSMTMMRGHHLRAVPLTRTPSALRWRPSPAAVHVRAISSTVAMADKVNIFSDYTVYKVCKRHPGLMKPQSDRLFSLLRVLLASALRTLGHADSNASTQHPARALLLQGKGAVAVKVIKPTWVRVSSGSGISLAREGTVLLEFATAVGERTYDWNNKGVSGVCEENWYEKCLFIVRLGSNKGPWGVRDLQAAILRKWCSALTGHAPLMSSFWFKLCRAAGTCRTLL